MPTGVSLSEKKEKCLESRTEEENCGTYKTSVQNYTINALDFLLKIKLITQCSKIK